MKLAKFISVPVLATMMLWSAGVGAAEPSISVKGGSALDKFNAQIGQLSQRILADAAAASNGPGSGFTHFVDFNKSLSDISGYSDLSGSEQALLRGAKRTYDLFRALGGQSTDRMGVIESRDGRYYLTLDGEGGRWVSSPEEALTLLMQQLNQLQLRIYPEKDTSIPCPFNFECLLTATFDGNPPTIAFIPRGSTVDLLMTGDGFENIGGAPVVKLPEGFIVLNVAYVDAENITARVSIPETIPLGFNALSVYNEGKTFASLERYGLKIVSSIEELLSLIEKSAEDTDSETASTAETDAEPSTDIDGIPGIAGSGTVETLTDDHPAATVDEAGELPAQLTARLETSGDIDLFKITIAAAGQLSISSAGPTDISATLETANGAVVANDDDAGPQYNFAFQTPVTPGTYYLRVNHCCGGAGSYRLSQEFSPN